MYTVGQDWMSLEAGSQNTSVFASFNIIKPLINIEVVNMQRLRNNATQFNLITASIMFL